ncbi:MAG: RND family transporter, partial [Calditrichota bacterium]
MSPESQQSRFDRQIVAFTRRVIQWRWAVIIATFLLVMLAGRGATGLFFDTEYRAFFGEDNPELQAFEELQNVYTKNDNILFVVSPENGAVFSPEHLEAIEKLTSDAWQLPFSIRVDAVTNYQHTYSEEDDLIVADLIANAGSLPDSALAAAKAVALKEPLLRKRLVNPDASVTGVNVT